MILSTFQINDIFGSGQKKMAEQNIIARNSQVHPHHNLFIWRKLLSLKSLSAVRKINISADKVSNTKMRSYTNYFVIIFIWKFYCIFLARATEGTLLYVWLRQSVRHFALVVFACKFCLFCLFAHGQCRIYHIYHVEFHLRFGHLITFSFNISRPVAVEVRGHKKEI